MKNLIILFALALGLSLLTGNLAAAAPGPGQGKKILFVPLDNRPITCKETAEAAEKAGYTVLIPPDMLLGARDRHGDTEGLWRWLRENAPGAQAAVVSTDALLYGSLVDSRTHELTEEQVAEKVSRFQELHEDFPRLPVYGFGTILRTLLTATHSGSGMELETYQQNAVKIYDYSKLRDKADMGLASRKEKRELQRLENEIAPAVMEDWSRRHELNFSANKALMDLARQGDFSFLFLGADDGAFYSQTHYELRLLREYGRDIGKTRFQITSGADELGMVMLCRAICNDRMDIPFVYAAYNEGKGEDTIPGYCVDRIGDDVANTITAAGGMQIPSPQRAELVMAVSTNPDGSTGEANAPSNTVSPRRGTLPFVKLVQELADKGYPVAVADIAYGNGADNALMHELDKRNLLFRLQAYGGWNTATNTTGFLIGTGLLSKWMTPEARNELLLARYLEDWGYQANVRQSIAGAVWAHPGFNHQTGNLDGARDFAAARGTELLQEFARQNIRLPEGLSLEKLRISHPWNRLFECEIDF